MFMVVIKMTKYKKVLHGKYVIKPWLLKFEFQDESKYANGECWLQTRGECRELSKLLNKLYKDIKPVKKEYSKNTIEIVKNAKKFAEQNKGLSKNAIMKGLTETFNETFNEIAKHYYTHGKI